MGRKSRAKKERRATQEAATRYALADAELLLADAARTLAAAAASSAGPPPDGGEVPAPASPEVGPLLSEDRPPPA